MRGGGSSAGPLGHGEHARCAGAALGIVAVKAAFSRTTAWLPLLGGLAAQTQARKANGWHQHGDDFTFAQRADGTWFVSTFAAPRGDAVTGRLEQEFVVPPAARELRGVVFGGSEAVQLWRRDDLLHSTRGRRSNEVDVPFRWQLDEPRGERVRLVISDAATGRWGFVSVCRLELVQ